MDLVDFYNNFHRNVVTQNKIIGVKNFTYRKVVSILEKFLDNKKSLKILDYGCGVGTIAFYLANKGIKVIGIDISDKAIEIAKKSAKALKLEDKTRFYTLKGGVRSIRNKKFDLVIALEVLEHVEKDSELLEFLANCLKRRGFLIISVPSSNAPLNKLGLTKEFDKRVGHLRRYTAIDLVKKVKRNKLKVIQLIKTEGIIRNFLFVIPILGNLVRFIRGPLSDFVTFVDDLTVPLFGESDIFVIAQKK